MFLEDVSKLEEALKEARVNARNGQLSTSKRVVSPFTGRRHTQRVVVRDLLKAKSWLGLS